MAEKSRQGGTPMRQQSGRRSDVGADSGQHSKRMNSPHPQDEVEIEIEAVSEQEFIRDVEQEEARKQEDRKL